MMIANNSDALVHVLTRLDDNMGPVDADKQTIGSFTEFQASMQHSETISKAYFQVTLPNSPNKSGGRSDERSIPSEC